MKPDELEQMSIDDLWKLRGAVDAALELRLIAEKSVLERQLKRLKVRPSFERRIATSERRRYPPVSPKFRNPDDPSETWAGRGKQPRWLAEQLRSGKTMDDFKIEMAAE